MRFAVSAEAYDRFMGRYSVRLAPSFADFASVARGQRVLDVGCGTGALTTELVHRQGASSVAAVDPSDQFADAARKRHPGVEVQVAPAEELPFPDGEFDASLAQLVVHFMDDPLRGLAEMARVARRGGLVAACVWDHAGKETPLAPFWQAAQELDAAAPDQSGMAGGHQGHLTELFMGVGLRHIEEIVLPVSVRHESFEEWWEPFTLGVGPAGLYFSSLEHARQAAVQERSREILGPGPLTIHARVWAARGYVSPV